MEDLEGAQYGLGVPCDDDVVEVGGDDIESSLVLAKLCYLFQHWLEGKGKK